MQEIKIRLHPADLERLNAEAAAAGTTRTQLIRDRALALPTVAGLSTMAYHQLVADAAAFMRGDLSRHHVESLVAFVIARLHETARNSS